MSESRRSAIGPEPFWSGDSDGLTDEAFLEEIQYDTYVRQRVLRGLEAERGDKTLSHDEMKQRLAQWLEK